MYKYQTLSIILPALNEEKSISFTLGIPFRQVLLEWQQYYTDMVDIVAVVAS